jgi:ribosome biogenesis GTPase
LFTLNTLGWNDSFWPDRNGASSDLIPARVVEEQRELYLIHSPRGEAWASLAGKLRNEPGELGFPGVGDWVLARHAPRDERAMIVRVLPRRSCFSRAAPLTGAQQIIAANIDVALVVAALGGDFNVRRIERYIAAVWESGARPVVVLTKCDLHENVDDFVSEVEGVAPGVRIVRTSAIHHVGIESVSKQIGERQTAVIVGSSGTGKSTLINALLGSDVQEVFEVGSVKDKGRHTTTARKLFLLPSGGIIIDTPGMRELQFYDVDEGLSVTFEDVERLVTACKFTDCQHRTEPGCAVREALDDGTLDRGRWASYQKLQREAAYQQRENDVHAQRKERERWKKIAVNNRKHPKLRF